MLALLRAHRVSMAVSGCLLAVATALTLVQPLLAGRLVDRVAAGAPVLAPVVVLILMLLGQLGLEAFGHLRLDRTGEAIVLKLRTVFTDHVVRLPIGVLDSGRTGDLLARGTSDAGLLRDMPRAAADIVFGLLTLCGVSAFMLTIDAVTVCVVILVLAGAFTAGSPFLSRIQRASLDRQAAVGDYTAGLDRTLGAARTVKLFGAEDREVRAIDRCAEDAYEAGARIAAFTAINMALVRFGIFGALLVILVVDGRRVADGGLSIGQFVSLLAFATYALFPINAAFTAMAALRTAAGAYEHLSNTLRELPEGDPCTAVPARTAEGDPLPTTNSMVLVEFDRVSFSHGSHRVLDDVSFTIGRNEVTALVGPSGSGKSTILGLLCRFYEPDEGVLRWAGHDIRRLPLRELRNRLGLLEQDAPVLHGTIRDNLLIAHPQASDAELWQVLEQARLAEDVARLPNALDAAVSERGRSLSGGQRQRLALARAFLSRSELILMDEPTAHLDRTNEFDVMTNLVAARGQRSLLIVAHRLSTVANADRILVLEHGRVQAVGSHSELLHTPVYRGLIDHELTRD